ncbi:MAG: hypothetical protein ABR574_02765 [Cryomorphaceae bacterium]|nr:hypothetical protein [Flavobacteriales bacterium]
MNRQKGVFLLAMSAIYFVLHFMQHRELGNEIIRFYGKDFILVPILLSGVGLASRFLNKPILIGTKEVILAVVYCSVVFEGILPVFRSNLTADYVDVICYAAGGLMWHMAFREKRKKIVDKSVS